MIKITFFLRLGFYVFILMNARVFPFNFLFLRAFCQFYHLRRRRRQRRPICSKIMTVPNFVAAGRPVYFRTHSHGRSKFSIFSRRRDVSYVFFTNVRSGTSTNATQSLFISTQVFETRGVR